MSGLQSKDAIGVPVVKEADFINYITDVIKKFGQNISISSFTKKIGSKEFFGYQLLFANELTQRGLVKIIGNWVFYQTWIFDNVDDAKIIEDAVYSAKFK